MTSPRPRPSAATALAVALALATCGLTAVAAPAAAQEESLEARLHDSTTITSADYREGGLGRIVAQAAATAAFVDFARIGGADRYATAAALATEAFPAGATTAIVARGDLFPDALAGNYLAGAFSAPILLTRSGALPGVTAAALKELGVTNVVVVGGATAVSAGVEAELDVDYAVTRLGGADRYATGRAVAAAALTQAGSIAELGGLRTAIVGSGQGFADILAAGPISYARNHPLLITRPASLPAETAAFLTGNDVDQVVVVGGTVAVSAAVEAQIEALTGNDVVRFAGVDRFATATALAEAAYALFGFDRTKVDIARGDEPVGFADALAGGPSAGEDVAPIVLTLPNDLPVATKAFLAANSDTLETGIVFGGPAAVSQVVVDEASAIARGPVA